MKTIYIAGGLHQSQDELADEIVVLVDEEMPEHVIFSIWPAEADIIEEVGLPTVIAEVGDKFPVRTLEEVACVHAATSLSKLKKKVA